MAGEVSYDAAGMAAGFAALASVLLIIAGAQAQDQMAVYGVFMSLTGSVGKVAGIYERTEKEIDDAIHAVKRNMIGGARRNPDVEIDTEIGDVYIKGTKGESWLGNIEDYLPEAEDD